MMLLKMHLLLWICTG